MNDEAKQEFERAFSGEMSDSDKTASTDSGYGITPGLPQDSRDTDQNEMAAFFNAAPEPAGTSVGAPEVGDGAIPSAAATASPVAAAGPVKGRPLPAAPEVPPQFKNFGQAFKWHRAQAVNGGPKTFEWNGKKFTTQLKSEVGNRRGLAAAAPAASSRAGQPKFQAAAASAPIATTQQTRPASATAVPTPAFQPRPAAAAMQVEPLHVRQQKAYDEWQRQLSASRVWWGGKAILGPGQKERLEEAERNFTKLLSQTK